ncbi:MAG: UvrD-helicase domain-containing protein, partial [Oscillospiraceae bacterium]
MTNQQKNAVNVNGGVLVSASAGSGKTMVLTNRVLRLLKEGVTLDNLVIVTFTVASAEEMKERIQKELLKEADNDFLYQQQMLLPKAHISTIDSYCTWLLKNNFQKLSLDPNFRMADTAEINVIIKQACEEVFEIHYKEESFQKLVEFFCGKSDKELFDIFSDLYNYIRSFPH